MNIKLAENQSFYLGEDIKVTIKAIYRTKDGQRYAQLCIQAPKNMLVFRDEKVVVNAQRANDSFKECNDLLDNIGNRGTNHYMSFEAMNTSDDED